MPPLTNPVLDTLELARMLHPTMKNHRLNTLAEKYKVSLENHHRAVDDAAALGGILFGLSEGCERAGHQPAGTAERLRRAKNCRTARPFHCGIYALERGGQEESVQAHFPVPY